MHVALVLGIAGLLTAGFATNEMTHGAMAQGMGLGHHHMMDYDGIHCADMNGPHGPQHVQHMHHGDMNATHMGCSSAHHQMDHNMGMNGGHMGGM